MAECQSAATVSSDHDTQKDEMLALASIFDPDEFSYKEDNSEFSGLFKALLSLPGEITIEYKLLPRKKRPVASDTGDSNKITVKFLPPIELSFSLPLDYPSNSPPRFTLKCSWLSRKQLSQLCENLDRQWNENIGLEILYSWMSFLKEESYSFLKLSTSLNLSLPYTFNINRLEKLKKLQRSSDGASSSMKSPDAAGPSTSSKPAPNIDLETKTVKEDMCAPGCGVPAKGRGRGRGRSRFTANSKPGASNCRRVTSTPVVEPVGMTSDNAIKSETNIKGTDTSFNSQKLKGMLLDANLQKPQKPNCPSKNDLDPRAVPYDLHQTPLISYILEYNQRLSAKEFNRNIYPCRICLDDKPGCQCVEFIGCGHVFCHECVSGFFEVHIRDGNVHALKCPAEGCNSEALQSQIADLVSPELFSRYDELLLSATLDKMEDIVYCPRKTCQYPVTYDPEEQMARCAHCSYTFCILCRMGYHGVDPCRIKMELELIGEYESATEENKQFLEKKYGRKALQELVGRSRSEQWINQNSKSCPHCSAAIEKSDGCNKMTCWKCNTFFCWLCNVRLEPSNPYRHFQSQTSKCFNKLFLGIQIESDESDIEEDFYEDEYLF